MTRLVRPYDVLLDGRTGWQALVEQGVSADRDALRLGALPPPGPAPDPPTAAFDELVPPRSVAVWEDRLFIADPDRHLVWAWRACHRRLAPVAGVGGPGSQQRRLDTPTGLTISDRGDLVVVEAGNRRLQLFTLPDLALRRVVGPLAAEPDGATWQPVAAAPGPGGALFVADRAQRVWRLDRQGRPDPDYGGSLPAGAVPERLALGADGAACVRLDDRDAVVLLDPCGRAVPPAEELHEALDAWVSAHVRDVRAGVRAPTADELVEALAALLPGDLGPRLAQFAQPRPEGDPAPDWPAAWARVIPGHLRSALRPPALRLDGEGLVLAVRLEGACCAADVPTDLTVDRSGRLRIAAAATPEVVRLLVGGDAPTGAARVPVVGGAVRQLLTELSVDPPLDASRATSVLEALGAYLAGDPLPGPTCRPASLPAVDCLRVFVRDDAAVVDLVGMVLRTAAAADDGGLVLAADAVRALREGIAQRLRDGPRIRVPSPPRRFPAEGLLRVAPLDSGRLGNPWHRVVLELDLPQRTSVRLFTFTSDVPRTDVDATPLLAGAAPPWEAAPPNAGEWLVQSPPGRYLHVALVLRGPGDRTPAVQRVFVYASRSSSLRFLPVVYSEDETSRAVLDRLLSLTDTVLAEVESEIESFPLRLGSRAAPPDYLPWLGSWFDLRFEQDWTEEQRRRVLAEVVDLHRRRGTVAGLTRLLGLHTGVAGPLPRVVEHHRGVDHPELASWFGTREADEDSRFTVLLPATAMDTERKRASVERLMAANAPAQTALVLRPVLPGVRVGGDTTAGGAIGFDTLLGSHRPWRLPPEPASGFSSGLERMLRPDTARQQAGMRLAGGPPRPGDKGKP